MDEDSKRAKLSLEAHLEEPVFHYNENGSEIAKPRLKPGEEAFEIISRLDFDELRKKSAEDVAASLNEAANAAAGSTADKIEPWVFITEKLGLAAEHLTALSDLLGILQKTGFLQLQKVNSSAGGATGRRQRLITKRETLTRASEQLRAGAAHLRENNRRDNTYFAALQAACQRFNVSHNERVMAADLAYASAGSASAASPNTDCTLRMATDVDLGQATSPEALQGLVATSAPLTSSRLLKTHIPIALRSRSAVHVFVTSAEQASTAAEALPLPPPISENEGWLACMQAARKHAFDRELFNQLSAEATAQTDYIQVRHQGTALLVDLGNSQTLVARLVEGPIVEESTDGGALAASEERAQAMDVDSADQLKQDSQVTKLAILAAMALRACHRDRQKELRGRARRIGQRQIKPREPLSILPTLVAVARHHKDAEEAGHCWTALGQRLQDAGLQLDFSVQSEDGQQLHSAEYLIQWRLGDEHFRTVAVLTSLPSGSQCTVSTKAGEEVGEASRPCPLAEAVIMVEAQIVASVLSKICAGAKAQGLTIIQSATIDTPGRCSLRTDRGWTSFKFDGLGSLSQPLCLKLVRQDLAAPTAVVSLEAFRDPALKSSTTWAALSGANFAQRCQAALDFASR